MTHAPSHCAGRLERVLLPALWMVCAAWPALAGADPLATPAPAGPPGACLAWGAEAKIDLGENSFCPTRSPISEAVASGAGGRWAAAASLEPASPKTGSALELEVINPVLEPAAVRLAPLSGRGERVFNIDQVSGLRARWWLHAGALGVGAGADWAVAAAANDTAEATDAGALRPVIGVRAELSQRTRLVYEFRAGATQPERALAAAATPESRWALEFKATGGVARQLPAGVLRLQLSGSSTLHLRPRRGGFAVAWRSRF